MLEIILAKFEVILASETPSFIPVLVQMHFFLTFKRCSSNESAAFVLQNAPCLPISCDKYRVINNQPNDLSYMSLHSMWITDIKSCLHMQSLGVSVASLSSPSQ